MVGYNCRHIKPEAQSRSVLNLKKQRMRNQSFLPSFYDQTAIMEGHFFNQKNNKGQTASLSQIKNQKQTHAPLSDDDFGSENSLNQLNVAFIADESKFLLSDSQSVVSQGLSISGISVIRNTRRMSSPMVSLKLEEEFSGVQDWPIEHTVSFAKPNLKRPSPSIDQEISEESIQNRCTKKKMNEKMKVVTINTNNSKNIQKAPLYTGYLLRSRAKAALASESSSNEQLRQMINDIQEQENGGMNFKTKLKIK